jgi:hypothetical protein
MLTTALACAAGFAALLDANGLTEADLESSPSSITELEMFLQQYPKVNRVALWVTVQQLHLPAQYLQLQQTTMLWPAHLGTVCLQMAGIKRFPLLTTLKLIDQVSIT